MVGGRWWVVGGRWYVIGSMEQVVGGTDSVARSRHDLRASNWKEVLRRPPLPMRFQTSRPSLPSAASQVIPAPDLRVWMWSDRVGVEGWGGRGGGGDVGGVGLYGGGVGGERWC